jgi:hypothetical protein
MAMESGNNVSNSRPDVHGAAEVVTSREFHGASEDFIPLLSDDSDDAGFVRRASVSNNRQAADSLVTLAPWKTEELHDFEAAPILRYALVLRYFSVSNLFLIVMKYPTRA